MKDDALFPDLDAPGKVPAQIVPTGPNHEAETFRWVLARSAQQRAAPRIVLTTPYLVLDEPSSLALAMAVERGVEVDVVVPRRSDHPLVEAAGRWYYEQLLEAGVNIYEYCEGMLHSKTITVDEAFALIGSANLDIRSFYLNFEINVLLYGQEITAQLRTAQHRYLEQCDLVDLACLAQAADAAPIPRKRCRPALADSVRNKPGLPAYTFTT